MQKNKNCNTELDDLIEIKCDTTGFDNYKPLVIELFYFNSMFDFVAVDKTIKTPNIINNAKIRHKRK